MIKRSCKIRDKYRTLLRKQVRKKASAQGSRVNSPASRSQVKFDVFSKAHTLFLKMKAQKDKAASATKKTNKKKTAQKASKAFFKKKIAISGLTNRVRGHVSASNKRKQVRRDSR